MKGLSEPIESLIGTQDCDAPILDSEFVIVGSGYGGAMAAMRLAGAGRTVTVLERGREYALGDFPQDEADIPSHIRLTRGGETPSGYADALFDLRVGEQTDVLVGSGLGGTSLINANVAEEPLPHVFMKQAWPDGFRTDPGLLANDFEEVRELLGVDQDTCSDRFGKFRALRRLSNAINAQPGTRAELSAANITVNYKTSPNVVGVRQAPCTDCGNCVTGCNVGAKNTLDRNLLPLAKSRGAKIYNGVSVISVQPVDPPWNQSKSGQPPSRKEPWRWHIHVRPTVETTGTIRGDSYVIRAQHVVLAAGTLGSNEILLRSRKAHQLALSDRLGHRFSTNGDGLIMSYGQTREVNAMASPEQHKPTGNHKTGPTINGISRISRDGTSLTLEDAAIPAAVTKLFNEMLITGAMVQRLPRAKLPEFISTGKIDPLAASRKAARHSQGLLVMGDDGADGRLSLPAIDSTVQIHFPKVADNEALTVANEMVKQEDRSHGLDGGQYVPNPLWSLLPEEAAAFMGGELPESRAITVHPLGGCGMGDSSEDGVVNEWGQVFNPDAPDSTDVHEGLYVMDGAVIPCALEVNPFLTITAIASRCGRKILERIGQRESTLHAVSPCHEEPAAVPGYAARAPQSVSFQIREQLFGQIDKPNRWMRKNLSASQCVRLTGEQGLVVMVEADIRDAECWLDNPAPLPATMKLYVNPLEEEDVQIMHPYGVKDLGDEIPFAKIDGTFNLLGKKDDGWLRTAYLWLYALFVVLPTFYCRRVKLEGFGSLTSSVSTGIIRKFWRFLNIARMQSNFRSMTYEFDSKGLSVKGQKILGYSNRLPRRLWPALLNLDVTIKSGWFSRSRSTLEVNVDYLLGAGLLKLNSSANLPSAAFTALGIGGYFARSLFTTNFWEFGGVDYPACPIRQNTLPAAIYPGGSEVKPVFTSLAVQLRADTGGTYDMLLSHYHNPEATEGPALLLHGLAQGSQIYWTPTLEKNLATAFFDDGYDVWLVDYRLSNHVTCEDMDWSMDEIAAFDIPAMINHIHEVSGQPVTVFAHCVGACTTAMAVLAGHLDGRNIKAAVFNAIHPWVYTSPANRVRADLGSFQRDWISTDLLDPIPSPADGAFHNALDRLAFSMAKIRELECDDHVKYGADPLNAAICDRMTLLYGRMWNHKNLAPETHAAFRDMFGPAPASVYRHLYYYSLQQRLTNKDGDNVYVTHENIRNHWNFRTLFIHGADSRVFNPFSAELSAHNLCKYTGDDAIGDFHIFDNYGHMDPIFSKDVHRDVYPVVADFYQGREPRAARDPRQQQPAKPNMGPILRAAWIRDNHIHLRYWVELAVNQAYPQQDVDIDSRQAQKIFSGDVTQGDSRHRFVDVRVTCPEQRLNLEVFGSLTPNAGTAESSTGRVGLEYENHAWYRSLRARLAGDVPSSCRFLVGSCRFPGTVIDNDRSDAIFAAMAQHADRAEALFLIGDQIYADATDQLFQVESLRAKYRFRYERAFKGEYSPAFESLVRQLPTHFAIDDHEFVDGWSGLQDIPDTSCSDAEKAQIADMKKMVTYARNNAVRFQSSCRNVQQVGQGSVSEAFNYDMPDEMCFPTFVFDSRSTRQFRKNNDPGGCGISDDLEHLLDWLEREQAVRPDLPKFVFSGSTIAPVSRWYADNPATWRTQDNWGGFPGSVDQLLRHIAEHGIQKVVLIGGDEHFSATASLQVTCGSQTTRVHQLVASGLYAPMPFANSKPKDYDWDQEITLPTCDPDLRVSYKASLVSCCGSEFMTVEADTGKLVVDIRDADNTSPLKAPVQIEL